MNGRDNNKKPTLGYETKGAAILALYAEGKTEKEIGIILNMPPNAVSSLAVRARERASRINKSIQLDGNIYLDLEREAVKRGLTTKQLAEQLLRHVIVDKLFGALLD